MGVREHHRVNARRGHGQRLPVPFPQFLQSLEQATVHEHAAVVHFEQVLRPGDGSRGAEEGQRWHRETIARKPRPGRRCARTAPSRPAGRMGPYCILAKREPVSRHAECRRAGRRRRTPSAPRRTGVRRRHGRLDRHVSRGPHAQLAADVRLPDRQRRWRARGGQPPSPHREPGGGRAARPRCPVSHEQAPARLLPCLRRSGESARVRVAGGARRRQARRRAAIGGARLAAAATDSPADHRRPGAGRLGQPVPRRGAAGGLSRRARVHRGVLPDAGGVAPRTGPGRAVPERGRSARREGPGRVRRVLLPQRAAADAVGPEGVHPGAGGGARAGVRRRRVAGGGLRAHDSSHDRARRDAVLREQPSAASHAGDAGQDHGSSQ